MVKEYVDAKGEGDEKKVDKRIKEEVEDIYDEN